jgi:flavin reductase (DIM6/NTAB) family NADH-FMN oxidoreductase RutF
MSHAVIDPVIDRVIDPANGPALRPVRPRLDAADFRRLMSCWSTGVAVVTSTDRGKPVGCTVSAVTSVSLEPPLLLVSLAARSRTLAAIRRERRLGLNLLLARRPDLARQFSRGDPVERFAGVDYDWTEGVPVLSDVVSSAVCVPERCVTVADHVLVVAEPVWWSRASHRSPLVCFDRSYWSLWTMAQVGAQ